MIENKDLYHFNDFTETEYSNLLDLAKSKFTFCDFTNYNIKDNFIIWRHDVDISMHRALSLARIEQKKNIISNYFILLHSEFYNLLEKEILHKVIEISNLGHFISLHFDSSFYNISNKEQLEDALNFERTILENLIKRKIYSFSFHNPSKIDLDFNESSYSGLINTYSDIFKNEIPYCSDSNGYWRFRRLKDVLLDSQIVKLQVLTHPEWWNTDVMSPLQKVKYSIEGRAKSNLKNYEQLLILNNRKIIDWQ